jgi:sigma-B regulation protein RsbU (phosphoserine phosphatase)
MAKRHAFEDGDLLLPLAVLGVVAGVDAMLPASTVVTASFAVAAVVASALTTVRRTALVGVAATVLAALSALWNHNLGTVGWWVRLAMTVGLAGLAVVLATVRTRRERALQHMTDIAEAAQHALLRPMPGSVGPLSLAARYVSATEGALVGGDLYEVAESPDGVRMIVGDVRGKGLDAVQLAATVLAAFRRAAVLEPSLAAVATDLDNVVTAVAGDEDFVTSVLVEFHDDSTVAVVNCGHHPPLLVTHSHTGRLLDTGEPQLPLGLNPTPTSVTRHLAEGTRVLFYTDGLIETRDRQGDFFPLVDSAITLRSGSLDDALDGLLGRLAQHAADRIDDDMALVLAECHPTRSCAE